jgi:dynamin 1-like protein
VGDQARDIEQQVLDLVLKYMRDPNSIILAINDSTQDIGASEALKYAEQEDIDPKGERTLCVLTKLDKLEQGSDTKRAINYLENKTKPLALGYVGVINRSQLQIDQNVDIETAKKTEAEVINRQEFRRLRHRMGIDYLRRFLTVILAQKMKELLPNLRKESMEELRMVKEQLEDLGNVEDAKKDPDDLVTFLVERAITHMRNILQGFTTQVSTEKTDLGAMMNEVIKQGTVQSAKEAREFFTVKEFHSKLSIGIKNSHAIRDQLMPVELVLDIGVGLMTENYRYHTRVCMVDPRLYYIFNCRLLVYCVTIPQTCSPQLIKISYKYITLNFTLWAQLG